MTNRHLRWVVASAAALVALALLASGCRSEGTPSAAPPATSSVRIGETRSDDAAVTGGSLTYGLPHETNSWNPALAQWVSYSLIEARSMFDFLTEYGADGAVHPSVAQSLTPNTDFTEWTIVMRPGVTFSNGTPLDAEAVATIGRYMKASPVLSSCYQLIDSWEVRDALTVVIHLNRPWASLPAMYAAQPGALGEPSWLAQNDGATAVGSGPFVIDHWDIGTQMRVKRNPNYWRKDSHGVAYPYLDSITFKTIADDDARIAGLRSGDLDVILENVSTPAVADLKAQAAQGKYQYFTDASGETPEDEVTLNTTKAPFNDVEARQALAYATDQDAYRAALGGDQAQPARGPFAPGSPYFSPSDSPGYDLQRAKELVDRVKAKNGGTFAFTLIANDSPDELRVQQFLQQQWAKAGIDVTLQSSDQQAKIIQGVTGAFQAALQQNFDAPDPSNDCIFWMQDPVPNPQFSLTFTRLRDQQLTEACWRGMGSTDASVRHAAFADVQQRLAALVPYVWLAHVPHTFVASTHVVNLIHYTLPDGTEGLPFAQGSHQLFQVWIAR